MNLTDEEISMVLSHADAEYFGQGLEEALVNDRVFQSLGTNYGDEEGIKLNTIDELCSELCKHDELERLEPEYAKSWLARYEAMMDLKKAFENFISCSEREDNLRRDIMYLLRQARK